MNDPSLHRSFVAAKIPQISQQTLEFTGLALGKP